MASREVVTTKRHRDGTVVTTIDGARYVVTGDEHEVMWLVRPNAYHGCLPVYTRRRPTLSSARVVSAAARAGEQVRHGVVHEASHLLRVEASRCAPGHQRGGRASLLCSPVARDRKAV